MENIELLTVAEVAPMVRMKHHALYRACREKQFPHVRIGTQIRIPKTAVAKWIESQVNGTANKDQASTRAEAA